MESFVLEVRYQDRISTGGKAESNFNYSVEIRLMNVTVLAPHPDDEVLGCGGTISRLTEDGHNVSVVFFSGHNITHYDADSDQWITVDNVADGEIACDILGVQEVYSFDYEMATFNSVPHFEMNKQITELGLEPDLILTPTSHDANWDHEIVHRVALVMGRPKEQQISILCYEILSSTEWGGEGFNPNFFVEVSSVLDTKLEAMSVYEDEIREFPHPRSIESIKTTAKRRGSEAGYEAAEAFEIVRAFPETLPRFEKSSGAGEHL